MRLPARAIQEIPEARVEGEGVVPAEGAILEAPEAPVVQEGAEPVEEAIPEVPEAHVKAEGGAPIEAAFQDFPEALAEALAVVHEDVAIPEAPEAKKEEAAEEPPLDVPGGSAVNIEAFPIPTYKKSNRPPRWLRRSEYSPKAPLAPASPPQGGASCCVRATVCIGWFLGPEAGST